MKRMAWTVVAAVLALLGPAGLGQGAEGPLEGDSGERFMAGESEAAPAGPESEDLAARIDAFVEEEMRRRQVPGLSLAVLRDGAVELLRTYGLSNLEHRVPVRPETVFQSGSVGKQLTAAAVVLLAEDGKLALDDPIRRYFPEAPESWEPITVRHLLTHTSGMGDYPDSFDMRRDHTEEEYLEILGSAPLAFPPGTRWSYSNLGYVTLGFLIERVSGQFYGDFLAERVFRPLGMETARVMSEADIVPNRAAGYRLAGGELKNQEWVSPATNTTADGSLYLSILDLARWDAGLHTDRPLSRAAREAMWTPVQLAGGESRGYGFGWHVTEAGGRRVVYHAGAWQGFRAFIVRFLDDGLSIAFLANSSETRETRLARGLIALFHPELAPPAVEPIADTEPEVTSRVRRALLGLSEGAADPALFTAEAWAELAPRAAGLAAQLGAQSLPIAQIYTSELVGRGEEGGLRGYRYALYDLTSTLFCDVRLAGDGKIARLELSPE